MKAKIGKYKNWVGPYQIASALCFWAPKVKDEIGMDTEPEWVHKFGTWLAEDKHGNDSWLTKACVWVDSKRKRSIKIRIDPWDSWGADHTIALIAHPLLIQLKATKQGSPNVDDADVPEHLRSTAAPPKENEWDTDANWHLRWDWVMDEMIWAMGEIANNKPGEDKFYDHGETEKKESLVEKIEKIKVDYDGLKAYNERLQNGCRLFGSYFMALWD